MLKPHEFKTGVDYIIDLIIKANPEARYELLNDDKLYIYSNPDVTPPEYAKLAFVECTEDAPMITSPNYYFIFTPLVPTKLKTISRDLTKDNDTNGLLDHIDDIGSLNDKLSELLDLPKDQVRVEATDYPGSEGGMFYQIILGNNDFTVVDEGYKGNRMENDPMDGFEGFFILPVKSKPFLAEIYPNVNLDQVEEEDGEDQPPGELEVYSDVELGDITITGGE